jgi:hypothetical protein
MELLERWWAGEEGQERKEHSLVVLARRTTTEMVGTEKTT